MKKVVTGLVLAISFMFANMANANVILSLDPSTQASHQGGIISVTLMIDSLGDFQALSLSSFDINLAFDTSALSFTGYNLFNDLGDVDLFEALDSSFGDLGGGIVNISELSFLSNFDLWNFQPGSFALAELFFVADAAVISTISIDGAVLVDVNGDAINIIGANSASVNAVPTPATSILMALGLLVMFVRQKYSSSGINRS
jgi:hypothetical protein